MKALGMTNLVRKDLGQKLILNTGNVSLKSHNQCCLKIFDGFLACFHISFVNHLKREFEIST